MYTVLVTPTAPLVKLDVAANVAADAAGNKNRVAAHATSVFDADHPAVDISGVPPHSNAAFTAKFTFNEAVTGFSQAGILVAGATLSDFTAVSTEVYTVCSDAKR